mmetsp:Transcript_21467/g.41659  ORF Transcript_21467/g.41659 Transcript_21467/m.41659 type:complete len:208 (-) Transcript_21467:1019-1642(-)
MRIIYDMCIHLLQQATPTLYRITLLLTLSLLVAASNLGFISFFEIIFSSTSLISLFWFHLFLLISSSLISFVSLVFVVFEIIFHVRFGFICFFVFVVDSTSVKFSFLYSLPVSFAIWVLPIRTCVSCMRHRHSMVLRFFPPLYRCIPFSVSYYASSRHSIAASPFQFPLFCFVSRSTSLYYFLRIVCLPVFAISESRAVPLHVSSHV